MSPYATDYLRYAWQLVSGFRAEHERQMATRRAVDIAAHMDHPGPWRILDLANGRLRPQYTLLRAEGHEVHGVDLANQQMRSPGQVAYRLARRAYAWRLGLAARHGEGRTLTCGDVGRLPFGDSTFDLVTSVAALEHFLDVPAVLDEVERVLRPGALGWFDLHPFACPSGGHNVSFTQIPLRRVRRGMEPWDHLRRRAVPSPVPLNEWRRDQYLEAFTGRFELLAHYCAAHEGEHLLTPEIRAELEDYEVEELTCRSYTFVIRKRPQAPVDTGESMP